jgi:DUF1707 SHOCT-like domain
MTNTLSFITRDASIRKSRDRAVDGAHCSSPHEDRDRVVDALRVAGGDGRLTTEELDARLERALSARTLGELAELTADFTDAVITSRALRIEADMVHGKLFIVSSPGIVINTDGLTCTYSRLKIHSTDEAADSRLRVEFADRLLRAKIIERRPRR